MTGQRLDRILETVLYVRDLVAAERFYADTLGLPVDSRKDGVFVFFRLSDQMLLLFRADAVRHGGSVPGHGADGPGHVCFGVPETALDEWRARLHRAGIAIEHEQTWPRGSRSFYFRDPDGNSLEIASPRIWGLADAVANTSRTAPNTASTACGQPWKTADPALRADQEDQEPAACG